MRKGFTLVELSIVLVIIGLLIGGILVAQSMITTTKLQALIRQVGQFDAAVENFKLKFNGLPGDIKTISGFDGTTGNSDGNGLITSQGRTSDSQGFSGEVGTFWHDLSISGMSTQGDGGGNTPANTYAASGVNGVGGPALTGALANVPKAKAGKSTAVFISAAIPTYNSNYYFLATTARTNGAGAFLYAGGSNQGAIKPADALSLDGKLDDGIGNTGNIMSANFGDLGPAMLDTDNPPPNCVDTPTRSVYLIANTTENCILAIRMGLGTGNLK
jgi:prepilin-type N-terminal cleavage/methylation domain-containing protein